jgi:hypothetical protein
MQSHHKFPVPFVEIDIKDDAAPSGYRRISGLVGDQFSLLDFFVENDCLSPVHTGPDGDNSPEWYQAFAEIDVAEWALYGLIRGVNRNSSVGSSNERSPWGDLLIEGRTTLAVAGKEVQPIKRLHLGAEFVIGRLIVRICWITTYGHLVQVVTRESGGLLDWPKGWVQL